MTSKLAKKPQKRQPYPTRPKPALWRALSTIQHDEARKLLPIIASATRSHRLLNYQTVAAELGRPKDNAWMVAQVCDLLDSAAALAEDGEDRMTNVIAITDFPA
jgi:hypothetical protein